MRPTLLLLAMLLLTLTACGSERTPQAIGICRDADCAKLSPCACAKVPTLPYDPSIDPPLDRVPKIEDESNV